MLTGGMLDSHDGKPRAQLDRCKTLVEVNQANKSLVVLETSSLTEACQALWYQVCALQKS